MGLRGTAHTTCICFPNVSVGLKAPCPQLGGRLRFPPLLSLAQAHGGLPRHRGATPRDCRGKQSPPVGSCFFLK